MDFPKCLLVCPVLPAQSVVEAMDPTHTALMSDHHAVISPKVKVAAMNLLPRGTGLVNDSRATVLVLHSEARTVACTHGVDLHIRRL